MTLGRVRGDDSGFTLIEILVAIALLGIAVAAIVGGMMTMILSSDIHRKQATGESVMRGYAEAAKAAATTGFSPCASTYTIVGFDPDGYTVSLDGVDYWDPATSTWKAQTATPSAGCSSITSQRLRLSASSEDGRSIEGVQLVVRKPNS